MNSWGDNWEYHHSETTEKGTLLVFICAENVFHVIKAVHHASWHGGRTVFKATSEKCFHLLSCSLSSITTFFQQATCSLDILQTDQRKYWWFCKNTKTWLFCKKIPNYLSHFTNWPQIWSLSIMSRHFAKWTISQNDCNIYTIIFLCVCYITVDPM